MTDEAKKQETPKIESIPTAPKIVSDKTPGASAYAAREELEQRRTMLQNMKDFDFQIKKNQEDITNISEKVENLSKDLDDLVSLYEIVSEQMNPFVGLSKVTKKRLDALENFTKEVESVKTRIGELESTLEKNGFPTGGNGLPPSMKPKNEITAEPETSPTQTEKTSTTIPTTVPKTLMPVKIKPNEIQNVSDTEMDEILTRSLEALLIDQNIDTIMNDYFLSLK